MIDRRPALIARCDSQEDVIQAVNFALEEKLPTSPEESNQGALLFHFPDDPSGPPPLRRPRTAPRRSRASQR
jgi:hypothetical protein